jgi:acetylornithine/succinyldiaminopimelate/putrescine aminotransferase
VKSSGLADGGFIISFDGAFHGRTLGSLAVTHRKKARLGFPTFDWPHVLFPTEDARSVEVTLRREERSLRQVYELMAHGRLPVSKSSKETFRALLDAIDAFLAGRGDLTAFVAFQRAALGAELLKRAKRAAAVLVEPVQGEGGIRLATARFFRRLRVLTRIFDVPLMFDEVQTGFGATGHLWAHELFELPAPPDVVVWAKKAQNGVLFVSEELATFFQEEKKFNTTWEGDSVGMARLLALLPRLDLEQVRRTGAIARKGLERLAQEFPELIQNARGQGVMLAFDVVRPDWRDALRDRAFRLGLILLPAGERALRFYPRYDTEPYAIHEALDILRQAVLDILGGRAASDGALGPEFRVGLLEYPLSSLEPVPITHASFEALRSQVMAVEVERYGAISQYPPGVLKAGRRPLLQYPAETLESTLSNARSIGLALRDRVSGRIIAYSVGSPVENHDEEGVRDDPRYGEYDAFFLQALATLPSVRNRSEVENRLLELLREQAAAQAFVHFSALVEEYFLATGPDWLRSARVLRRIENYLGSGIPFVYVQTEVVPGEHRLAA